MEIHVKLLEMDGIVYIQKCFILNVWTEATYLQQPDDVPGEIHLAPTAQKEVWTGCWQVPH